MAQAASGPFWEEGGKGCREGERENEGGLQDLRRQGFSVKSLRNFSHSSSMFPLPRQLHQGDTTMPVGLEST